MIIQVSLDSKKDIDKCNLGGQGVPVENDWNRFVVGVGRVFAIPAIKLQALAAASQGSHVHLNGRARLELVSQEIGIVAREPDHVSKINPSALVTLLLCVGPYLVLIQ